MDEHRFDAAGVCIYCDSCEDFTCCSETELECSQWKRNEFMKERIRKEFNRDL